MSFIRIIPSLLLKDNILVKGNRFRNHKNAGSPKTTIKSLSYQGADEINLLNIDDNFKLDNLENLKNLLDYASTANVPLTFGGGIDNIELASKIVRLGFEKIYVSRGLLNDKYLAKSLVNTFGGQAVVAGINLIKDNSNYKILNSKDQNNDIINFIKFLETQGIGEVKITFVDNEGQKNGLDLEFCKIILKYIQIPCIFEGGIGSLSDIKDALDVGVSAISLGTLLTFGDYNVIKIKTYLKNHNYSVRL